MALNPLNSTSLLASLGALGIFIVLFAETGLLIGFFLPGDSLLFRACARGGCPIATMPARRDAVRRQLRASSEVQRGDLAVVRGW